MKQSLYVARKFYTYSFKDLVSLVGSVLSAFYQLSWKFAQCETKSEYEEIM